MVSREDRRAALLLLTLAAAGVVVRVVTGASAPQGAVLYRAHPGSERPSRDSVAMRAARLARPLEPGERIDLNAAPAEELARLPGIGPALASRIVTHRTTVGPFGSLSDLDRVSGIGPTVIKRVRPHVHEPKARRAQRTTNHQVTVMLNTATVEQLAQLPGIGLGRARAIVEDRRARGPYSRTEDLLRVRGIGPAIVERIRGMVSP